MTGEKMRGWIVTRTYPHDTPVIIRRNLTEQQAKHLAAFYNRTHGGDGVFKAARTVQSVRPL